MVDEPFVGIQDAIGERVSAYKLPVVFKWVKLGAPRRQRQHGNIGRDEQFGRRASSGLIEGRCGVSAKHDMGGELFRTHAYCFTVATGSKMPPSLRLAGEIAPKIYAEASR
ncbi:MAG: hypothetical protein H6916_13165 [Novosphingobium sp.]|uniref:hypothetical protein n=1 Tax=Novosphingobium sp. TaxID=1874826 RepID=UPI001D6C5192|nr:hypothetical protein [Novosphingobium sp.]MCB2057687.1 hypothetical protein [Novosphingobium sp.]MCP5387744.1 hypothetical protein [Novosphingobium sp.]